MKIGDLKRLITLQSPTSYTDELGQPVRSWATYGTAWAQIQPMAGNEALYGLQLKGIETHSVLVRWVDGLLPSHRLLYDGRIFNIVSIRNLDENRQAMAIAAMEWLEGPG